MSIQRNNAPATWILAPSEVRTFISYSPRKNTGRRSIDISKKLAAKPAKTAPCLLILLSPPAQSFSRAERKRRYVFFAETVAFMEKKIGKGNIFSAVVHMDKKTPHLHLYFTPITEDGHLSAKEVLNNRAQLSKWQDEFYAHMKKMFPILKRGESTLVSKRKHIPTWLFKQSVSLIKQQNIEKMVSDITTMKYRKEKGGAPCSSGQILSPTGNASRTGQEVSGNH